VTARRGFRPSDETIAQLPFDFEAVERRAANGALRSFGGLLRARGLSRPSLRATLGLDYSNRLEIGALPPPPASLEPAEILPWLFCAGQSVGSVRVAEVLGEALEPLTLSILPVRERLILCDRPDAPLARDTVAAPDLSAYYLIRAVVRRGTDRWLDVATGSGAVLLGGCGDATIGLATDLNERALAFAQVAAWLNGLDRVVFRQTDLLEGVEGARWRVVTFNPPLAVDEVDDDGTDPLPLYLVGRPGLLDDFWRDVRTRVDPDGEVVVHSPWPADPDYPRSLDLPGEVVVTKWTVAAGAAFCTTSWRPGGPPRTTFSEISPNLLRDEAGKITRAGGS
jgi:hypothetical protein